MPAYDIRHLRVLIVDGNWNMVRILRQILRALGMRDVKEAADGASALKAMVGFPADIILTDWEMEPMNGLEFVRRVRDAQGGSPFVPIIMISGHTELARVVEARNAGINEYVAKPVSARSLYARIVRVIDAPRRFVRSEHYFGPDRRFHSEGYEGPERREDDEPGGGDSGEVDIGWED